MNFGVWFCVRSQYNGTDSPAVVFCNEFVYLEYSVVDYVLCLISFLHYVFFFFQGFDNVVV